MNQTVSFPGLGLEFHFNNVAFHIASKPIYWYGILIMLGVILAVAYASARSRQFGIRQDDLYDAGLFAVPLGIVCARIYYVIFEWEQYKDNLSEIFATWHGGLAIYGGIIGGIIVIVVLCKVKKIYVMDMLDLFASAVPIGQILGRWGNFFNCEAYGTIVTKATLENMKIIPEFVIKNMYINGYYHLPMFYFESLWCFLGFIIALILRRRKYIKKGQLTGFYLMWYGVDRFVIEIFRTDSLMLGNLKVARIVSVIMFILGVMIELVQSRKPKLDDLYNSVETEEIRF